MSLTRQDVVHGSVAMATLLVKGNLAFATEPG